jgi:integrase
MTVDPGRLDRVRRALAELGVSPAEFAAVRSARMPTIAVYLPRVEAAAGPGAQRTYGSNWRRMAIVWADLALDEVLATDFEAFMHDCAATAVIRRGSRGGRHAGEHAVAAARAFFNRAIADGYLTPGSSPAHRVAKPRRLPSPRRALTAGELAEINEAARISGNDTALDALLLRLHTETACRRGGALALRRMDIDRDRGLVRLREKGETMRWQPVTLELAEHLLEHATFRGAHRPEDQGLRYRNGRPLTSRRYDHLWTRLGQALPWVAAQGVSTHWLRHTTLTWVERNFGYGIARAYAGHTDRTGPATTTYIKADLQAVATAGRRRPWRACKMSRPVGRDGCRGRRPDHVGGSTASARWFGSSRETPTASTRVRPSVHSAATPGAWLTYG